MQSTTDGATRAVEIGLAAKLFDGFADRTRLAILVELLSLIHISEPTRPY